MTTNKKEDRRVRYTKKAIKDSFLELFETKPFEKISVTEICNKADINRGTFYSHYSDPHDLKKALEDEFLETIKLRINECSKNGQESVSAVQTLYILRDNKDLCRVFTGPNGDFEALIRIIGTQASNHMSTLFNFVEEIAPAYAEFLQLMLASCISSVIKYWLDNDMQQEPEIIAEAIEKFFRSGLDAFMGEAKK